MCAAETRWVRYETSETGRGGDGNGQQCKGTRAYSEAMSAVGDSFDIGASNNRLYVYIDTETAPYITLMSGTDLDPRLVARNITEKLHDLGPTKGDKFGQAQCVWENNHFQLYSGTLGSSSAVAVTSVSSGTSNSAHLELGWGVENNPGGVATSNQYNGGITISGTYNGFFDEIYKIVLNKEVNVGTPSKDGSNTYQGTIAACGAFNHSEDVTYTLSIDADGGRTTMDAGTGNVPKLDWDTGGKDDNAGDPVELLYSDYWYHVGTKGLMVKFTDRVFNTCDPAWTIACTYPQFVQGANTQAPAGTAKYIWAGTRGDCSDVAYTTQSGSSTTLGDRGLNITFTGTNNFLAGDEFYVVCTPPQPASYDISNLDYGNVTVSTESSVECVIFEIVSGAVMMSTVKFGLQSHGTFQHHGSDPDDTKFRFGTVGPGNNAGDGTSKEWRANVTATDIGDDTPPSYLYATKGNLSVVSDADSSEAIGSSHYMGITSDPIWLCIKLGASEVGANASINHRIFFDYS